jgi:hypothetical protein
MISELLISKEEQDRLQRMDRLRRDGEEFIKVINHGPAGFNRIHAVDDIEMVPYIDPDTGETKYKKERVSKCVVFDIDRISGERFAWVLDTEYNRHFIARHLTLQLSKEDGDTMECFSVDDRKVAKEIEALVHEPFSVEKTKKEQLREQAREIERQLKKIQHEEEKLRNKEKSMKAPPTVLRETGKRVKEPIQQVELSDETSGV